MAAVTVYIHQKPNVRSMIHTLLYLLRLLLTIFPEYLFSHGRQKLISQENSGFSSK